MDSCPHRAKSNKKPGIGIVVSVDPVCGMEVEANSPHRAVHDGRTYLFCSSHCLATFQEEPSAYTQTGAPKAAEAEAAAGASQAIYTCPMHPEVRHAGPGSCPKCGMALEPAGPTAGAEEESGELRDMRRRFWVSLVLTAPVFVLAMGHMIPGHWLEHLGSPQTLAWVQLAFATPVVFWCAWPFMVRAVQSVRLRSLNMFTLIGLGVSVAYAYSVVATLFPWVFPASFRGADGQVGVYFEAATVIVTLVLLGQVLELKAQNSDQAR